MIDLKKTKKMIREMKADHIFSKSEATQLSILVDRVKDGRDDLAIMLAQSIATEINKKGLAVQSIATEINKKGLAVQKFVGFLKGVKEEA